MTQKKIPISFSDSDIKEIGELANLIGLGGSYGETPKALKFSIKLALSMIKNPQKVYSGLDDDNLRLYFSSMLNYEKILRANQNLEKTKENLGKV